MAELPETLRLGLANMLVGASTDALRASVDRLIGAYRSGTAPTSPILRTGTDIAAYAAYRMPATYSAVRAALRGFSPVPAPAGLLDIGGGTGAAVWAALDAYPGLREITVVDQVEAALNFGRQLALASASTAFRSATWRQHRFDATPLPTADLATVSYVLGELEPSGRRELIEAAMAAAPTVVIVEPGTPAGYQRIIEARTALLEGGRSIAAPCPHQAACPIVPGQDWCHFGARVNRSSLHRRIKDADLSYEDEKFSYVVGVPADGSGALGGRVLRRPTQRKGLVSLHLCQSDGSIADRIVTKRNGEDYRRARDVSWGDFY
jgi:ribosomal protein RSM22 (predicted rRNA methylase)